MMGAPRKGSGEQPTTPRPAFPAPTYPQPKARLPRANLRITPELALGLMANSGEIHVRVEGGIPADARLAGAGIDAVGDLVLTFEHASFEDGAVLHGPTFTRLRCV